MIGEISYKMTDTLHKNGDIEFNLSSTINDKTERLSRWIVKTQEERIKERLIELGWTPPMEQQGEE